MCKLQSSSNFRVQLQSHHDDNGTASTDITRAVEEPSSACLWAMVNDFLEVDTPHAACTHEEDHVVSRAGSAFFSCCAANCSETTLNRAIQEMESIKGSFTQDVVVAKVAGCVAEALKTKSSVVGVEYAHDELALPGMLKLLRREGYDAGLCVTERKPANATEFLVTGGHQFIDVIMEEMGAPGEKRSSDKLIVDVNFRAHFEIARPLPAYQKLIALLPSTFVGKAMILQRVLRIMSQAARASLESHDMPIPPWRSFSFLLAKWFSPSRCRITTFSEAKHHVLNTSSFTNRIGPCALAELNNRLNSANLARPPVNKYRDGSKSGCLERDAAQAWYPPTPSNQICISSSDSDDALSSSTKKRRQANAVSALALAFAETTRANMLAECVAASQGKVHNSLKQRLL